MLHDLDASVAALLAEVLNVPKRISFERPGGAGWSEAPQQPTLLCSLSHFDEDLARRASEWRDVRGVDGLVVGRQPPVRWLTVTYLVTAWAADAATEHEMLGEVLTAFVLDLLLDERHRRGGLADLNDQLGDDQLWIECRPASIDRTAAVTTVVTTADSGPSFACRPALELSVVVPIRPALRTDVAPPARSLELGVDHQHPHRSATAASAAKDAVDPMQRKWTAFRVRETTGAPATGEGR